MHKKLILFFAGILLFLVACEHDLWKLEPEDNDTQTLSDWKKPAWNYKNVDFKSLREAEAYYELDKPEMEYIMTRSSGGHPLFSGMVPNWKLGYTRKGKGYTSVEIPLKANIIKMFVMSENEQKYKETGDRRYLQTLTRLVVLLYDDGREPVLFFMTISPSVRYMELTNFCPFYNTYPERDKQYDGKIHFHNLKGEYVNGWLYREGRIAGELLPLLPGHIKTRGSYEVCEPVYKKVCYQTSDGEDITEELGEATVTAECNEIYVGEVCTTYHDGSGNDSSESGSSESGNSGGGTNPGDYGGDDPNQVPAIYKVMDMQYTNLNSVQQRTLSIFLDTCEKKYPLFNKLLLVMYNGKRKIRFYIDPEATKGGSARYDSRQGIIYYYGEKMLSNKGSIEDFAHAAQYQLCYNPVPGLKNIEFEAKIICDMIEAMNGNQDIFNYKTFQGVMNNLEASQLYYNFWEKFNNGDFVIDDILWQAYDELGCVWDDPDYQNVKGYKESVFDPNVKAKLIKLLFKK